MSHGHYGFPVIWPSEWQVLTPVQKSRWIRGLVRRTHRARMRAIGKVLFGWARYLRRRQVARDLAELWAMDDILLRDVGLSRSEVRAAIESGSGLKPRCKASS
ncbi:MAG: DUF1127 domain-containing protein [Bradyrhizobium sp.]